MYNAIPSLLLVRSPINQEILLAITFKPTCKPSKEIVRAALACPNIVHSPPCQVVFTLCVLGEDGVEPPQVDLCIHVVGSGSASMPATVDVVEVDGEKWVRAPTCLRAVGRTQRHGDRSPDRE